MTKLKYRIVTPVEMASETATDPGSGWWLSFCDTNLPRGSQFLGGCLVTAPSLPAAITASHVLGINPGGEIAISGPLSPADMADFPARFVNALLSKELIAEMDEVMA